MRSVETRDTFQEKSLVSWVEMDLFNKEPLLAARQTLRGATQAGDGRNRACPNRRSAVSFTKQSGADDMSCDNEKREAST